MLAVLAIVLILLFLLYKYYAAENEYWRKRGIPGPQPELFFGNLRDIWSYERPRSLVMKEWTKKYGKVYGMYEGQRKFMVVSDLEMLNELLVKKFDHFYARSRFPLQPTEDGPKMHLVDARGAHWKRLRALGSYAFTNKALKQIRATIVQSAHLCVEAMKKESGEFNIHPFFQEYTMDVICKIALGKKDVKMFNNPMLQVSKDVFSRPLSSPLYSVPCLFPYKVVLDVIINSLDHIGALFEVPFVMIMKELEATIVERKKERDAGAQSTGDFIDIFLDAETEETSEVKYGEQSSTEKKLVLEEIVGQCMIFLLAGFETTSNALAYVTHFLANYPDIQEKLYDEIDGLFPDEKIDYDTLSQMTYTEAVLKETLRHYPLASFVVSRECVKPTTVGGYEFKEGDMIYTDTWSMHMDKEIWGEDAEEFRPERFLEASDRARVAFQAFGEGPRMCLGMRLAYFEEKIALIHLLKTFVIIKSEHTNPLSLVGSMTIAPAQVMVKLEKRSS